MILRHTARQRHSLCLVIALIAALLGVIPVPQACAGSLTERFSKRVNGSLETVDHSVWTALLQRYVIPGSDGLNRVAYARFRKDGRASLEAYLTDLQQVAVSSLDRPEQFAFWANLYNALTVGVVLDHYPVKSIRDIHLGGLFSRGPWKQKLAVVEGVELSLDNIEHDILRSIWRDSRTHYAVNCASVGCPNLLRRAYTGARLNKMLDASARAYINSPRGAVAGTGGLVISSIYKWYSEDFGGTDAAVLAHLKRFADPPLRARLAKVTSIAGYRYDWRLNDGK